MHDKRQSVWVVQQIALQDSRIDRDEEKILSIYHRNTCTDIYIYNTIYECINVYIIYILLRGRKKSQEFVLKLIYIDSL